MKLEEVKTKVHCCTCGGTLIDGFVWVDIPIKVEWKYPTHGNIISGDFGNGCAFICDECEKMKLLVDVKHAIEFIDGTDTVIYHEIDWETNTIIS